MLLRVDHLLKVTVIIHQFSIEEAQVVAEDEYGPMEGEGDSIASDQR
jgi:hypothetical protein